MQHRQRLEARPAVHGHDAALVVLECKKLATTTAKSLRIAPSGRVICDRECLSAMPDKHAAISPGRREAVAVREGPDRRDQAMVAAEPQHRLAGHGVEQPYRADIPV